MSDEKIGFHKGSIQTLVGEKAELLKMVNMVDQLIAAHNNALKEFNIDYVEELKKQAQQQDPKNLPKLENPPQKEMPQEEHDEDFEYDGYHRSA